MKWEKKGIIVSPEEKALGKINYYAAVPVPYLADDNTLRIYFTTRNAKGQSTPVYIEVDPQNPADIKHVHDEPLLPLGDMGAFDDSGIMPSWIVKDGDRVLMYYIGWKPMVTVSYQLSIGCAVSYDDGKTFEKVSKGPIADRAIDEPFFNSAPCVMKEGDVWKLWYISCTEWRMVNNYPEPLYLVKYATSTDGLHWNKTGHTCIGYDDFALSIGRPCVYKEDDLYYMLYSYRGLIDYRTSPKQSYRLGVATSVDGINWDRKDNEVGIGFSEEGWDSIMMEYCSTYKINGRRFLLYNGNGFGRAGFGYAELVN